MVKKQIQYSKLIKPCLISIYFLLRTHVMFYLGRKFYIFIYYTILLLFIIALLRISFVYGVKPAHIFRLLIFSKIIKSYWFRRKIPKNYRSGPKIGNKNTVFMTVLFISTTITRSIAQVNDYPRSC